MPWPNFQLLSALTIVSTVGEWARLKNQVHPGSYKCSVTIFGHLPYSQHRVGREITALFHLENISIVDCDRRPLRTPGVCISRTISVGLSWYFTPLSLNAFLISYIAEPMTGIFGCLFQAFFPRRWPLVSAQPSLSFCFLAMASF